MSCLFCMFVCGFSSHWRMFHLYGNVTIAGDGRQVSTYDRHSWSLSSEGSLACHTYCDTGHPFIMVISEDPWHSHLLLSVWQWSCHYLFLRLRSVAAGIRTPKFRMRELRSNPLHHRRGYSVVFYFYRYWVNSTINICYRKCFKVHVISNV